MKDKQHSRPEEDAPIPGLAGLRDVAPPPSLMPAVMRRIAEPATPTFWQWLRKPRRIELRLSPLGALSALAAGAFAVFAVVAMRPSVTPPATLPAPARPFVVETPPPGKADQVLVRFVLVAKGARKVALAGNFNGWNPDGTVLEDTDGRGTFVATVPLPRGSHEYMFVLDGEWLTDPAAAEVKPDGFGRQNAVIRL